MNLIVLDETAVVDAVRNALVDESLPTIPLAAIISPTQLKETISDFEFAADNRYPDAMAQVSPRALLVALAVLKAVQP